MPNRVIYPTHATNPPDLSTSAHVKLQIFGRERIENAVNVDKRKAAKPGPTQLLLLQDRDIARLTRKSNNTW